MKKLFLLMFILGLGLASCDKGNEPIEPGKGGSEVNPETDGVNTDEGDDLVNGLCPESVVITPAELCIDLAEGCSAKFTTNEPSYFMGVYLLGDSLEFSPGEILGWMEDSGAVFVWSCRGEKNSVPFEIGSDWYTLRQIDEMTYEVTIDDVEEERLIIVQLGSRVKGREPGRVDIAVKPQNNG
jgi:hypothetical protein